MDSVTTFLNYLGQCYNVFRLTVNSSDFYLTLEINYNTYFVFGLHLLVQCKNIAHENFRHTLLFYFGTSKKASEAYKDVENYWSLVSHPRSSPDLASSGYYLFRYLPNSFNFNNDDNLKLQLVKFFADTDHKFYVPEEWQ